MRSFFAPIQIQGGRPSLCYLATPAVHHPASLTLCDCNFMIVFASVDPAVYGSPLPKWGIFIAWMSSSIGRL
jgi:hypothetical protein